MIENTEPYSSHCPSYSLGVNHLLREEDALTSAGHWSLAQPVTCCYWAREVLLGPGFGICAQPSLRGWGGRAYNLRVILLTGRQSILYL